MRTAGLKKGLGWSAALLLILGVLLASLFAWAVATESGGRQVWRFAQPLLPAGIEIAQIQGSIAGPLRLSGVRVAQAQSNIEIEQVELSWAPRLLLRGELLIHQLAVTGVRYTGQAAAVVEDAEPFEWPEHIILPILIRVERLQVDDTEIVLPEQSPLQIDRLALAARLQGDQWRVRELVAHGPLFELAGDLRLRSRMPYEVGAEVTGVTRLNDWPELDISTTLKGNLDKLAIDAQVQERGSDSAIGLRGDLGVIDIPTVNAALQWRQLRWPLNAPADYLSDRGELKITGNIDRYRISGAAEWLLKAQQQAGELTLSGDGNRDGITLQSLQVTGAPGRITGAGRIDWSPRLSATLDIKGNDVNPGAFAPAWPGRLDIASNGSFQMLDSGWDLQLDQLQARGTLREMPLIIEGSLRHDPTATHLESLLLESVGTRVTVTGSVTDRFDMTWRVDSTDFAAHLTGIRGVVNGEGTLRGRRHAPRISARLEASDVVFDGYRMDTLRVGAELDAAGAAASWLDIAANELRAEGLRVESLTLQGRGTPGDHRLQMSLQSDRGALNSEFKGSFEQGFERWRFGIDSLTLTQPQFASLALAEGSNRGVISRQRQVIERTCLRGSGGEACAELDAAASALRSTFTVRNLLLAQFSPFIAEELTLGGSVDADGEFQRQNGRNDATVAIQLQGVAVSGSGPRAGALSLLRFDPGTASVTIKGETMSGALDLPLPDGGIAASIALRSIDGRDALQMNGEVQARLGDLNFLRPLVPEITAISGSLETRLQLGGTTAVPSIVGDFDLQSSSLALASPGLQITDLSLSGRGVGDRVALTLGANSGGGLLEGNGELLLDGDTPRLNFTLTGDEFEILNTRAGRIWASPKLDIKVANERVDVTGRVAVPRADITPDRLPVARGAVSVSSDQVIVDEGDPPVRSALADNIHAAVRVIIGDPKLKVDELAARGRNYDDVLRQLPSKRVNVEGFGLRGIVVGNLMLTQSPGEPALGSGELRIVTGRYQAYGQDLTIQDGRIVFAGGRVTEPGLNIRAVRNPAPGIMAGVHVRGRLDQPDVKLISDPPMTQTEQVSWLVLGRAPGATTAEETDLLTRAALALGTKGGNYLGEHLGRRVGLDEVGIESGATASDAAFVVGKYLTPKLIVSYGIGLFDPVSTLRMRYRLSPRWQLESQSSAEAAGGDIIYSVETGD